MCDWAVHAGGCLPVLLRPLHGRPSPASPHSACVLLFQNTITTFYQTSAHCSPTPCFRAVQDALSLTRATCARSMVDRLTSSLPLRAWSIQATKSNFLMCDIRRLLVGCCSSLSLALPGNDFIMARVSSALLPSQLVLLSLLDPSRRLKRRRSHLLK